MAEVGEKLVKSLMKMLVTLRLIREQLKPNNPVTARGKNVLKVKGGKRG